MSRLAAPPLCFVVVLRKRARFKKLYFSRPRPLLTRQTGQLSSFHASTTILMSSSLVGAPSISTLPPQHLSTTLGPPISIKAVSLGANSLGACVWDVSSGSTAVTTATGWGRVSAPSSLEKEEEESNSRASAKDAEDDEVVSIFESAARGPPKLAMLLRPRALKQATDR